MALLPDKHSDELKCVSARWKKLREAGLFAVIDSLAESVILSLKKRSIANILLCPFCADILMTSNYFFFPVSVAK